MMRSNNLKTVVLMAALSGLLIGAGRLIAGPRGFWVFFLLALLMNLGSYWFSDRIALRMARARPLLPGEVPWLDAMVGRLCARAGIVKPRLFIIGSPQPNAFATGRNPGNACVAVTEGLLESLTQDEVEGVLAHELAHISNRDILIQTIAVAIGSAVTWIAHMAMWGGMFGGDDEDSPVGGVGTLLLAALAPIAATIIQLALSRSREFQADEKGASIAGRSQPLARALQRIERLRNETPMHVNPASSSLYIINPLRSGVAGLFSTHPPTAERVKRLLELEAARV